MFFFLGNSLWKEQFSICMWAYISCPMLIMLTLPLLCLSVKVIAYPPPICNGGIGGKTQPFLLWHQHYHYHHLITMNEKWLFPMHAGRVWYVVSTCMVMNYAPNVICLSFYSLSHYCNCTLPSLIILTLLGKWPKMIQRL